MKAKLESENVYLHWYSLEMTRRWFCKMTRLLKWMNHAFPPLICRHGEKKRKEKTCLVAQKSICIKCKYMDLCVETFICFYCVQDSTLFCNKTRVWIVRWKRCNIGLWIIFFFPLNVSPSWRRTVWELLNIWMMTASIPQGLTKVSSNSLIHKLNTWTCSLMKNVNVFYAIYINRLRLDLYICFCLFLDKKALFLINKALFLVFYKK